MAIKNSELKDLHENFEKFIKFNCTSDNDIVLFTTKSISGEKSYKTVIKKYINTLHTYLCSTSLDLDKNDILRIVFLELNFLDIFNLASARHTEISLIYDIPNKEEVLNFSSNWIIDFEMRITYIIQLISNVFSLNLTIDYVLDFLFEKNLDNSRIRELSKSINTYLGLNVFSTLSLQRVMKLLNKNKIIDKLLTIKYDVSIEKQYRDANQYYLAYFPETLSINYRIYANRNRVDHLIDYEHSVVNLNPAVPLDIKITSPYRVHLSRLSYIDGYVFNISRMHAVSVLLININEYKQEYRDFALYLDLNQALDKFCLYKYVLCNMLPLIMDNLNTYILYFKKRLQENSFVTTNFNSIQGYSLIKFLEYKVNLLQDPNFIHLVEENYYGISTTENSAS